MLVVRERQREFQDFHRLEKDGLRIHEKEKQSRPNRKGVIREIKSIKTSNSVNYTSGRSNRKMSQTNEFDLGNQKQKLNIFDQQDQSKVKRENLLQLGYGETSAVKASKSLVAIEADQKSVFSSTSRTNALEPLFQKPKAIDYLNKGREGKETCKAFIGFSRSILMS